MTGEDAATCLEYGVDGVVVSNHGGRNEETLHATIDALPEVVSAVQGRIPVLLDGGIRRGTDVFKALALGATAVGIGRPQVWGLAAFGQPGVELAMDILNRELRLIMRQAGVPNTSAIDASRTLDVRKHRTKSRVLSSLRSDTSAQRAHREKHRVAVSDSVC